MMIATRSILRLLLINNKKQTSRHLSQERCLLVCSAPGMGNNLVVKVHYRLGSRNC